MGYEQPQELPKNLEELDEMIATTYVKGMDDGKDNLRKAIKEYMLQEFFAAKGRERRADQSDPKVQAVNSITQRLYAKFEDGSL